ncbi:Formamidopyrimidine-DNA glycosylase [Orpheovirus IHUMI-LCC2]|uniref:Formamidopyrimidine-DNA glycosylase n=1 Tax=Orpheovirus IHUMI-LCC2 TaxID=2023057 RepID=A0A2I2L4M5_9VIRU|nr:Formamidopyrimidine-DNA glycosylase [Orpheovirus IHUMI-LCC2]SNW62477.1 Formamidopyrimidine-DNA glycosylase [Orpheovirus IHUMI-LCC2]
MPEWPEVRIVGEQLDKRIRGQYILQSTVYPSYYSSKHLTTGLEKVCYPGKIHSVTTIGKKILVNIQKADEHGNVTDPNISCIIVISLGMTGRVMYNGGDHCHIEWTLGRLVDGFLILDKIYYHNSRKIGSVQTISSPEDYQKILGDVGPDIMSINKEEWIKRIKTMSKPSFTIAKALLEQDIASGIGNYLKADILYSCKLYPGRKVTEINDSMLGLIFDNTRTIIKESYESQGLTIESYISPDGGKGYYKKRCYDRDKDDNGLKIEVGKFKDGRTTYWCPQVQIY